MGAGGQHLARLHAYQTQRVATRCGGGNRLQVADHGPAVRSCLPASRKAVRRFKYACHTVALCEQAGARFDAVPPLESCGVRQPAAATRAHLSLDPVARSVVRRKAREQEEQESEEMLWAGSAAPRLPNVDVMKYD